MRAKRASICENLRNLREKKISQVTYQSQSDKEFILGK